MIALLLITALAVNISANTLPINAGIAPIIFTADVTGGSGSYQYRWFRLPLSDDGYAGIWSTVQEWSDANQFRYSPPAGGGDQYIGVWVKDRGSGEVLPVSIFYSIKAASLPNCGSLSLSALGAAYSNLDSLHYLPLANKAYSAGSYAFPFIVPSGREYRLSSIHVVGKKVMGNDGVIRSGGVILTNLFTIGSNVPILFPVPLSLPSGTTLDGFFSNDTASEPMNMMVIVNGTLTGPDC